MFQIVGALLVMDGSPRSGEDRIRPAKPNVSVTMRRTGTVLRGHRDEVCVPGPSELTSPSPLAVLAESRGPHLTGAKGAVARARWGRRDELAEVVVTAEEVVGRGADVV